MQANEVAVDAFINEKISFTDIPLLIESILEKSQIKQVTDLEMLIDSDNEARIEAEAWVSGAR
jgi:1-deoxy-D-xylulose-5-phosphate reductoisomerase